MCAITPAGSCPARSDDQDRPYGTAFRIGRRPASGTGAFQSDFQCDQIQRKSRHRIVPIPRAELHRHFRDGPRMRDPGGKPAPDLRTFLPSPQGAQPCSWRNRSRTGYREAHRPASWGQSRARFGIREGLLLQNRPSGNLRINNAQLCSAWEENAGKVRIKQGHGANVREKKDEPWGCEGW